VRISPLSPHITVVASTFFFSKGAISKFSAVGKRRQGIVVFSTTTLIERQKYTKLLLQGLVVFPGYR
jgi:hypothetical protein